MVRIYSADFFTWWFLTSFNARLTSLKPIGDGNICRFLPMTADEMKKLGWRQCDVILVTGDAYVDHPSFAMAILGRTLEYFGFKVGIIAQPDWHSAEDFKRLGPPRLFWGVSAGNMDSMVNHYTADKKIRHDDAYTPGNVNGARPDRAAMVYANRCREAFKGIPVVIGGIEASLRRTAHFDYWSETVKRSVIFDAKADILLYGNGEHSLVELALRLNAGEDIRCITDIRGSAVIVRTPPSGMPGIDMSSPGKNTPIEPVGVLEGVKKSDSDLTDLEREESTYPNARAEYILMPSYDDVKADQKLYAHSMYLVHNETNPYCARKLLQYHGDRAVLINTPPIPLTTAEMDLIYDLPYQRRPHPSYHEKIPAYEMIKNSVTSMRGCFGGCAFCTIAAHTGKFVQCRSEESILREINDIKDRVPGFAGVISDIGGPSANMYRLGCKNLKAMQSCRRESCLFPNVCRFLDTDQSPAVNLYRRARELSFIKKVFISSGIRLDLAILYPEYIKELVTYHVSGHLKVAPEHIADGALRYMHKPGVHTYDQFEEYFVRFSSQSGKHQQIIPYFIACHPGTTDEDMIELAVWLKKHNLQVDQVQNFYPTPLSNATTMYYTGFDPGEKIKDNTPGIFCVKGEIRRRIQKAILRYHDPENYEMIRDVLRKCGKDYLIGNSDRCLVPAAGKSEKSRKNGNRCSFRPASSESFNKNNRKRK